MEPNKFEKHIKEQMQKREIQPTADAWERISERLDPSHKANRSKILRYSIAASFIGILMVSILFFQSENIPVKTNIQTVDTNKKERLSEQNEVAKEQNGIDKEENILDDTISVTSNEVPVPEKSVAKGSIEPQNNRTDAVVLNDDRTRKVEVTELLEDADSSIDLKIKEVLAQVDLLEQNQEALTDAEVDSLLYEAQHQLLTEKIFDKNASVDAMALLDQVEDELDQSFRDQIFEKLKSGFLKVRTAVADRNN